MCIIVLICGVFRCWRDVPHLQEDVRRSVQVFSQHIQLCNHKYHCVDAQNWLFGGTVLTDLCQEWECLWTDHVAVVEDVPYLVRGAINHVDLCAHVLPISQSKETYDGTKEHCVWAGILTWKAAVYLSYVEKRPLVPLSDWVTCAWHWPCQTIGKGCRILWMVTRDHCVAWHFYSQVVYHWNTSWLAVWVQWPENGATQLVALVGNQSGSCVIWGLWVNNSTCNMCQKWI